jgi:hypothetical protein
MPNVTVSNAVDALLKSNSNSQMLTNLGIPLSSSFCVYLSSQLSLNGGDQVLFTLPYTIAGRYEVRGTISASSSNGGFVRCNTLKIISETVGNMVNNNDGQLAIDYMNLFFTDGTLPIISPDGNAQAWTFQGSAKFTNYSSFTVTTTGAGTIQGAANFKAGSYIYFTKLGDN